MGKDTGGVDIDCVKDSNRLVMPAYAGIQPPIFGVTSEILDTGVRRYDTHIESGMG